MRLFAILWTIVFLLSVIPVMRRDLYNAQVKRWNQMRWLISEMEAAFKRLSISTERARNSIKSMYSSFGHECGALTVRHEMDHCAGYYHTNHVYSEITKENNG